MHTCLHKCIPSYIRTYTCAYMQRKHEQKCALVGVQPVIWILVLFSGICSCPLSSSQSLSCARTCPSPFPRQRTLLDRERVIDHAYEQIHERVNIECGIGRLLVQEPCLVVVRDCSHLRIAADLGRRHGPEVDQMHVLIWMVVKIMVPFWDPLNSRCRSILRTQKGTIILQPTRCGHARVCISAQVQGFAEVQSPPNASLLAKGFCPGILILNLGRYIMKHICYLQYQL